MTPEYAAELLDAVTGLQHARAQVLEVTHADPEGYWQSPPYRAALDVYSSAWRRVDEAIARAQDVEQVA
jgi:hypothetical protein